MSVVNRKLEVFAIHGYVDEGSVDYGELFTYVAGLDPTETVKEVRIFTVGLPKTSLDGGVFSFILEGGELGVSPLAFNTTEASERQVELEEDEVLAERTHGVIDVGSREAYVAYNHRGAKAPDAAVLFQTLARQLDKWSDLELEFTPLAAESFTEVIDSFARVRVASLRMARPNYDWSDSHTALTDMAQASDARTFEVQLTARRSRSLSLVDGIVSTVKDLVSRQLPAVKSARLIGIRQGEEAETTVDLAHYVEHRRVRVAKDDDGHVVSGDMLELLREYRRDRAARRSD